MSANYPPGTVATATINSRQVRVMRTTATYDPAGSVWLSAERVFGSRLHGSRDVTDIHPLVVLDLDVLAPGAQAAGPYVVQALREAARQGGYSVTLRELARLIEAQTRPPRIPEPGLWGVVEATADRIPRRRWVHNEEDRWVDDTGEWLRWADLIDPVLVRDGVEE